MTWLVAHCPGLATIVVIVLSLLTGSSKSLTLPRPNKFVKMSEEKGKNDLMPESGVV
jgi:hypothetical protein